MKRRVCVVGYGNVGKEAIECIRKAEDMEFVGLVRRNPVNPGLDAPVVSDVSELGKVDVAILTVPSREVPKIVLFTFRKASTQLTVLTSTAMPSLSCDANWMLMQGRPAA